MRSSPPEQAEHCVVQPTLICHRKRREITCAACGSTWTEQLVGAAGADGPLCPNCVPSGLADRIIQIEIALTAEDQPRAKVFAAVVERHKAFRGR
jgi:hypothetical protein